MVTHSPDTTKIHRRRPYTTLRTMNTMKYTVEEDLFLPSC